MIRKIESILLFSENAENLAKFYKEKVGLKTTTEAEMGEKGESVIGFEVGDGAELYIVDHSEIKGKSKEPKRIMFNFEVDKIDDEVERLEKSGVNKIQDTYHIEGYGKIATFEDTDGNYFQLAQIRES